MPIKGRGLRGTSTIVRQVPEAQGVSLGLLLYPDERRSVVHRQMVGSGISGG